MAKQFFDTYFDYVGDTEAPLVFHRWSILSCLSAALGRKCHIPLGHFKIYPSMYTMLIGASGTRKSTSITLAKDLLKRAGYNHFAADKTSKEKFILDLMDKNHSVEGVSQLMDVDILDTCVRDAEIYIVSDEFQDFLGVNNLDFITTLGKLWDVKDVYEHRVKTGKSALVERPVVNILGGNTPTGFSLTFPPDILGQGFLSRLLLIYGDSTDKRISWPKPVDPRLADKLANYIKTVMHSPSFKFIISRPAMALLDKIYQAHITIDDPRFCAYETRRHDHLLKLVCLTCVLRGYETGEVQKLVTEQDVLAANTILYYAERRMPLALGEFGKGKFADVGNSIMESLFRSKAPMELSDIWRVVAQDLNGQNDLVAILRGLQSLDKIQTVTLDGKAKFLPKRKPVAYFDHSLLLSNFLSKEEEVTGGKEE